MRNSLLAVFAFALLASTGCQNTRQLAPDGPYQGDALLARYDEVLLQIEATFDDLIALADRNPQAVAENESLQEAVAKVRAELDGIPDDNELLTRLIRTRNAYVSAKSLVTGQALENQLTGARTALETTRALLPMFIPAE